MQRRTLRRWSIAAGVLASAMIVGFSALVLNGAAPAGSEVEAELPGATAAHLADLRQAAPGNQGMSNDGPGGAADAAFAQRAFPDVHDLARRDGGSPGRIRSLEGPRVPEGQGKEGHVGERRPEQGALSRLSVPELVPVRAERVRRGRPDDRRSRSPTRASPGNCRLYITPAGGGIWTTKNGLAGTPHWEYLGGPLGINSAGAVTIDSNDPTGKTVYVGTGEANICGSGCVAGVGIYKSTDGGETWTGPLGGGATDTGNPLAGKGVAKILIKPGSPNTIYAATTTALRGMSESCCCGRHPAGSRRGEVGPLQVDERRRHVELHPQRLRQRGRLHRIDSPSSTTAPRARRAASARWHSTRRTRRSSTRARTHEESGGHPTAARPGRRSSRR